jgi:hypothetical protein
MGLGTSGTSRLQRTQADELGLSYRSEPLPPLSLLVRMARTAELPSDVIFGLAFLAMAPSASSATVRSTPSIANSC